MFAIFNQHRMQLFPIHFSQIGKKNSLSLEILKISSLKNEILFNLIKGFSRKKYPVGSERH